LIKNAIDGKIQIDLTILVSRDDTSCYVYHELLKMKSAIENWRSSSCRYRKSLVGQR